MESRRKIHPMRWLSPTRWLVLLALLAGCSSSRTNGGGSTAASTSSTPPSAPKIASNDAGATANEPDAGAAPAKEEASVDEPTFDEVLRVLFDDRSNMSSVFSACPSSLAGEARVRCLYDERYKGDPKAANLAYELWVKWKIVAGVEQGHTMNGGFRGSIKLEPAVPIKDDRKHLEWIVAAMRDFDQFFSEMDKHAKEHGGALQRAGSPKPYRFRPLMLRFMRSVGRTTPSAYAHDWTIAWNVNGSLHTSADAVRETLFHEIFHLNDFARVASTGWSRPAMGAIYDPILKKCGAQSPCLLPYTPNETMVRGGTYYSFQQNNGDSLHEYAAELALRYYREQRAVLRSLSPKPKAFKCGPPENGKTWTLMRDEFFGGIDAVPACP